MVIAVGWLRAIDDGWYLDDGAAELADAVLEIGFLTEDLDEVHVAFVGFCQCVLRETQLNLKKQRWNSTGCNHHQRVYFLRAADADDPSAVQRHVVIDGVVDHLLGYVFTTEVTIQSAHLEAAIAQVRPLVTYQ